MKIDLNCDMGEGLDSTGIGLEREIMPYITSANIACGLHAGNPLIMAKTVSLAAAAGVAIGAHPGYADLANFGRLELHLSTQEVKAVMLYQVGALAAICKAEGTHLSHIKPHGALYNQAAVDGDIAAAVASAVKHFSADLILVGLAGSKLIEAGKQIGLKVASEGFPDRAYQPNGLLMPRSQPGAVFENAEEVMLNALRLAQEGIRVSEGDGTYHYIPVDTLCLHGDNLSAVENARLVSEALGAAGFELSALG